MKVLRLSDTLVLPIEAVTEKLGFLGRTGAGKTYAAQKLAEEMYRVNAQFIALDPVGKWWSLRLASDGVSPGLSIPVFGGLHGDVPLEPTGGKLIADVIVDRGISAVVDVSQFESDSQKARFMTDFGNRFFFRKKSSPSAVHLFIEESQEFIPQNPQRDESLMLHVWTRIQKLGRNFGIGSSLISQRPQEVNKKVLNLTEVLFVFQLTGPQERKTVAWWIAEKGIDEDIASELPKLKPGCPHVWSPAWLQISKVIQINRKETYDASSTPKVGARAEVKNLAPIDLENLRKDMASTIERAKQEDPKELRKQIVDLKRQLESVKPVIEKTIEVPLITDEQLQRLENAIKMPRMLKWAEDFNRQINQTVEDFGKVVGPIAEFLREWTGKKEAMQHGGNVPKSRQAIGELKTLRYGKKVATMQRNSDSESGSNPDMAKIKLRLGERRMLGVLTRWYSGRLTKTQLASLSKLTLKAGTFSDYYGVLRRNGLIEEDETGVRITDAGLALCDEVPRIPQTTDEIVAMWREKFRLGERKMFDVLVENYPDSISRLELAERAEHVQRWPKFAESFEKAFCELYDRRKAKGAKSISRWKDGKEMFKWWITEKHSTKNPDQIVMFE